MFGILTRAAFRGYEWLRSADPRLTRENAEWIAANPSPWPYPPPRRRIEVAGTTHLAWFEEGGRRGAQSIANGLAAAGEDAARFTSILDFGCGCGRVIRHLPSRFQGQLHGCDIHRPHIAWCRRNLPFARFRRSPHAPPLFYDAASFDLIYAFSVFTHLPARLQHAWIGEFGRILAPGGLLALSLHGANSAAPLTPEERARFDGGEMVVRFRSAAGSNLCNAYHPRAWVERTLANGWEFAAFLEEGALGNPRQDLYVLRKPRA